MTTNTVHHLLRFSPLPDVDKINFRHRRDGEADRGYEGHNFGSETTEEGEAAEEGRSSATHSRRFLIKQACEGCRFIVQEIYYEEVREEERCHPRRRRRLNLRAEEGLIGGYPNARWSETGESDSDHSRRCP